MKTLVLTPPANATHAIKLCDSYLCWVTMVRIVVESSEGTFLSPPVITQAIPYHCSIDDENFYELS